MKSSVMMLLVFVLKLGKILKNKISRALLKVDNFNPLPRQKPLSVARVIRFKTSSVVLKDTNMVNTKCIDKLLSGN